jgi:integrase
MSGKRGDGEGTYYARPDGGWLYRMRVGDGRRVSGSGRTKSAAKTVAHERARLVADKPATATVQALVTEWSKLTPASVGLRATTADQYRALLRAHVVPALGPVRLSNLTRRLVADAVRGFSGSASTRRSAYAALVKLLDYGVGSGVLAVNLARETPRPLAGVSRHRGIDQDAARALLAAASGHRWGVAAWLGFGCGLRRGEALGLRWADVDLEAGELAVNGNVTRSSAGLVRGAPKTRRGQRRVPIPASVIEALKAHRTAQAAEQLAALVWTDHGLVLTNEVGGLVEPRALSRAWSTWARKAGLTDRGTHAGRHYAATTLLSSGAASVADVAAALGHDPAVLLNTYAVAVAAGQRAASDVLGGTLGPDIVPTSVPTGRKQ